ncbi:MAG: MerR family transcriptional regulator [Bacteroidaceae bacterium]
MKSLANKKIYYSIREVAEMFGVNESLLRYWEKEFPKQIAPRKTEKGTRQYTQQDIENIRMVYHLVKERKMSLSGARESLKVSGGKMVEKVQIIDRLKAVRNELIAMKKELDDALKAMPVGAGLEKNKPLE